MKCCRSGHEVRVTVRKSSKRPSNKWRACLKLRKKDIPLRKMPCRDCVQERAGGKGISIQKKISLDFVWTEALLLFRVEGIYAALLLTLAFIP